MHQKALNLLDSFIC